MILTQQGTTSLWTFTAFSNVTILTDYITQPSDELSNSDTVCSIAYNPLLYIVLLCIGKPYGNTTKFSYYWF